jgi:hypothetical protein
MESDDYDELKKEFRILRNLQAHDKLLNRRLAELQTGFQRANIPQTEGTVNQSGTVDFAVD